MNVKRTKIKSIRQLADFSDEYVYDVGMSKEDCPWFFGNNILVHNSEYFSVWPLVKDKVESGELAWDKEKCIEICDGIADYVNVKFPDNMVRDFNCPREKGSIIRAGREIVATRGLFITKKRYALMYYDKDGKRVDKDGKPGKVKAMGLDLKRADTPKVVQEFLMDLLTDVLNDKQRDVVIEKINKFKAEFRARKPWEKGKPMRVNNLTKYGAATSGMVPGHVSAAIHWNTLRQMNGDLNTMPIVDGQKCIVCRLKTNAMEWTNIAYPTDEKRLPHWFLDLSFDEAEMEKIVIDEKIDNLLGVLDWDIKWDTDTSSTFNDLFDF